MMRSFVEGQIKRLEDRFRRMEEPAPEFYGIAMRVYCETGTFPEGTHPRVKEYTLKALATAQAMREGMGIR